MPPGAGHYRDVGVAPPVNWFRCISTVPFQEVGIPANEKMEFTDDKDIVAFISSCGYRLFTFAGMDYLWLPFRQMSGECSPNAWTALG